MAIVIDLALASSGALFYVQCPVLCLINSVSEPYRIQIIFAR